MVTQIITLMFRKHNPAGFIISGSILAKLELGMTHIGLSYKSHYQLTEGNSPL